MPPPPPTPGRFAAYQTALKAISARTGTPLSSLVVSFGILHELTAVLPILGLFYASRSFGVGEQLVNAVTTAASSQMDSADTVHKPNWIAERGQVWIEEGEQWAVRIGRRYGWFGFEKRTKDSYSEAIYEEDVRAVRSHLAGDIANVVVAYASTKVSVVFYLPMINGPSPSLAY
ncbi:hypothetical protein ONZ45_g14823 [Pleurotus djamor]|nr:hypothetical protein ONZ45_g14823 [Pleurotus djamor]